MFLEVVERKRLRAVLVANTALVLYSHATIRNGCIAGTLGVLLLIAWVVTFGGT